MGTVRLDVLLTRRLLSSSRSEAKEAIDAGLVSVKGMTATRASQLVDEDEDIAVAGRVRRYVSRGGEKLEAALRAFSIDVANRICLDAGASTGGFTDCLLQHGAAHVTAIDVGHGQMDPRIASDPRVEVREGINARLAVPGDFPYPFDLIVVDLSFISLRLVLPALRTLMRNEGGMICLVKPQFEVGRDALGKGGIVRSDALRKKALDDVRTDAAYLGFKDMGWIPSPLLGGDGNAEFLLWLQT